jgi:3-phosphoshikimate 1-carboxyvinyltransferase
LIWTVDSGGSLHGAVRVPGDKSISHRALFFNALAVGPAKVTGLLQAEDVGCTAAAVQALGATLHTRGDVTVIRPPPRLKSPDGPIDCGNSGTTMRLLSGLLAAEAVSAVLVGDASLSARPMARVSEPLRRMGATIAGPHDGRLAPLHIHGPVDRVVHHELTIASAQVKTCVLLAGRRVGVSVREPRQSRDHSERMLRAMGAELSTVKGALHLLPCLRLEPVDVVVPGDISAAAFWLVAASIVPGSDLMLPGVGLNPTRTGVLSALLAMGADIEIDERQGGAEPIADLRVRHAQLHGVNISGDLALRCLDELPVIAVAAAFAEGETRITDAAELRHKESDRIARTAAGLRAMGVEVQELPDGLVVQGGSPRGPCEIDATGDHRIAMAFAVAGCVAGPVRIAGAHSVRSSYPDFPSTLEAVRDS